MHTLLTSMVGMNETGGYSLWVASPIWANKSFPSSALAHAAIGSQFMAKERAH